MADWRTDLTLARARLEQLEAAELSILTGGQVKSVAIAGERLEYADRPSSLADVRRAIAEARLIVARLSGARRGGAIIPALIG